MNKLMRMLMMFGPMIFRQYQKYQQKKSRQQTTQNPNGQLSRESQSNEHQNKQ